MSDKKVNTFKWIFTEFFQMIGAPQPWSILIDQARAMEVAIADVMPGTTHRWCKWHVLKKVKESLGPLLVKGSEFKPEFNKLVHHMVTEKEFQDGWACMIAKHGQQKNSLLTQIYEIRRKWAKTLLHGGILCQDDQHAAKRKCKASTEGVNDLADEFKCECGMFDHFRMVQPCTSVMIQLGMQGSRSQEHYMSAEGRSSKGAKSPCCSKCSLRGHRKNTCTNPPKAGFHDRFTVFYV